MKDPMIELAKKTQEETKSDIAIVLTISKNGEIQMGSYGRSFSLCAMGGVLGELAFQTVYGKLCWAIEAANQKGGEAIG